MRNILLALTLAATGISNAGAVTTIVSIPTGTTNVGTFVTDSPGLITTSDLAPGTQATRAYAYRSFTPSVDGFYTLGMTKASYDPVLMLYSGLTSFNSNNAQANILDFDDDGNWGGWLHLYLTRPN